MKQKAFFYRLDRKPGVGVIAYNPAEGWKRINFYAFGVDMDALQKELEKGVEDNLISRGVLASRSAHGKAIMAGGVIFKGLTFLLGEGGGEEEVLESLERSLENFKVVDLSKAARAESLSPLEIYPFTYGKKLLGICKVVFFEYSTQVALVGIYREQDRNLLEELYGRLAGLKEYMTVPNPLRTADEDERVHIHIFMIRHPLKEELQGDFVRAIYRVPELVFYAL